MPGWLSSLRDFLVEASPLRRLTLALVVVLPLAALGAAYFWFNPPQYRVLYAKLSDRAGGEVIAALEQLDIPYRLSAMDGSIQVPADQLHIARYRLAARGLPRSDDDVQQDVERAPSFGVSSLQEQQRLQRSLEIELARSIQQLEPVELARVHLAQPKVSPFLRDAPSATAAVLIRLRKDARLTPEQVTTIQTLVAASVPRMQRDAVQVLDPHGMLLGGAAPEPAQSQRLAIEDDLVRRALAALTPWLGEDRVNVQVTATLEESETRETVERVQRIGKTVRTTRVPEGSIKRIQAIVVLGFEATTTEIRRARHMATQALGLVPARGDTLSVYVLPAVGSKQAAERAPAVAVPEMPKPMRIPAVVPVSPAKPIEPLDPRYVGVAAAGVLAVLGLGWAAFRRRGRREPGEEASVDDFDAVLDTVRSQVLTDPRVTADVIKLWMRA